MDPGVELFHMAALWRLVVVYPNNWLLCAVSTIFIWSLCLFPAKIIFIRISSKDILPAGSLREKGGAFVTLEKRGALRGCIGHMAADRPLYLTVQEMAIQAATGDPRFPPVRPEEVGEIGIEISVLSPLKRVAGPEEIRVGEHGIAVSRGAHRGILLPQVATREGWDREKFLGMTCLKAGLPFDAWKSGEVTIEVFSAEVFGEKETP